MKPWTLSAKCLDSLVATILVPQNSVCLAKNVFGCAGGYPIPGQVFDFSDGIWPVICFAQLPGRRYGIPNKR